MMDPVQEIYIPPPAYSEQDFDQKTSRATELSLDRAKWEAKLDLDEEGFPRYDPVMFEEVHTAHKGKDQPIPTTFRSPSVTKRPLPKPTFTSSSAAGPSTLPQTAPLHISKKSITKAEEAARDATWHTTFSAKNITASSPSLKSTPSQRVNDTPEDNPPYCTSVLPPNLPSIPIRSNKTTPEENLLLVGNISTHTLPSFPNHLIDDPGFSQRLATQTPDHNPPYAPSRTPTPSNQRIEDIPDDNPPYSERTLFVSDPTSQSISNSIFEDVSRDNPPYELHYSAQPLHHEQPLEEAPQQPTRSRDLLTSANRRLEIQPQYTTAPDSPQHFSLLPPRSLPRINTSDRPQSHSDIPSVKFLQLSGNAPRVVFNPDVAYGRNPTGGPLPQIRAKEMPQEPFQTHFNPHMLYK